jgi:N-acyl homoserine lactone hydrolase
MFTAQSPVGCLSTRRVSRTSERRPDVVPAESTVPHPRPWKFEATFTGIHASVHRPPRRRTGSTLTWCRRRPTITPALVAELLVEGERMPVYVHVINHPDARVLVDTGMTELHPAVADMDPRLIPLSTQDLDLAGIDVVVNTHLHFDHRGGNHLLAGRPIYVQRRELDDARSEDDYTIREWVEAPGVRYVPVDGELKLLPGLRLVPAPGHTRGTQVVVVETGGRPVVVGGDMAVWLGELDEPHTEGQLGVRTLDPELVWLAHEQSGPQRSAH